MTTVGHSLAGFAIGTLAVPADLSRLKKFALLNLFFGLTNVVYHHT